MLPVYILFALCLLHVYFVFGSGRHYSSDDGWKYDGKLFYVKEIDDPHPRRYKRRSDSTSNPFLSLAPKLGHTRHFCPVFYDMNGDDAVDVLIGTHRGMDMLINKGTPQNPSFVVTNFPGVLGIMGDQAPRLLENWFYWFF